MISLLRMILLLLIVLVNTISSVSGLAFTDAVVDFSIGAVAGSAGAFVAYPIDYVKCQMQTETGKIKYKNGFDCFTRTVTEDGPMQLFRGVGVQVAGIAPEKSIKLGVNDIVKRIILNNMGIMPLWGELLAASMSGLCQVIVTSPLEILKVSLQTSDKTFKELMADIGGVKGLYVGAEACILRDVLFSVALFPLYHHLQRFVSPFVAGSVAGSVAAFVATPPDFIKTRLMTQDTSSMDGEGERSQFKAEQGGIVVDQSGTVSVRREAKISSSKSSNPFVAAKEIARQEGWQVMFTGVVERCIGSIPRFGVTLSLYDFLKALIVARG